MDQGVEGWGQEAGDGPRGVLGDVWSWGEEGGGGESLGARCWLPALKREVQS